MNLYTLNWQILSFSGVKGDKGDQGPPGKDEEQGDGEKKGAMAFTNVTMLHVTKIYLNIPLSLLRL